MTLDFSSIFKEAINHLQNLIRINTTNPPGNEIEVIRYIAKVLEKEKIGFTILESAPNRANLIARIKGDQTQKPLLLTSHVDVVPAEVDKWKMNPFSGEIAEGCLWGRGAIDMKQMTVMSLMMLICIQRNSIKLKRDLILACVADEEAGCEFGSKWLVENHASLIQAEYALNEVGGFSLYIDKHCFYPIGVAERGLCWFKIISEGDAGHGSMPHQNQAVVKLADAITKLNQQGLGFHAHPVVKEFISQISNQLSFPKNMILKGLKIPKLGPMLLKNFIKDKKIADGFYAMLFNTASPTILNAGCKVNVIPSIAEVSCDGRLIPGQTIENFVNEVKKVIGQELKVEIESYWDPTEHDTQNDFFKKLKKVLKKHDEKAIPIPYMCPGFTDAAHYKKLGIKTYGFTPVKLPPEMNFSELFHGHNERIPIDGFKFGLRVMWDTILETCSQ